MQTQRTQSPRSSMGSSARGSQNADSIFDLLIADHRAVAGVFAQLKEALEAEEPAQATCLELFAKIDALLTPHARAEEELVYPAFSTKEEAEDPVAEGFEEHALVHRLCAEIKELGEVNKVWCAKAKVLMDLVEHHVREEENEMLPKGKAALNREEAQALGAEFLAGKERIASELGLPAPESLELPPPARSQPPKS